MIKRIKYVFKKSHGIGRSYFLIVGLFSIFFLVAGFSFALFTAEVERRGTLNIITGNLYSFLESEDLTTSNSIRVDSGESKVITIRLKNTNPVNAKFNLWYVTGDDVVVGYHTKKDVPPGIEGDVILEGDSKIYQVVIDNLSQNSQLVTFGSDVGLSNKELLFEDGHHIVEAYRLPIYQKLFSINSLGDKGRVDASDVEQTFITGEDPNNYIWYSGKLWRAVSKDTFDNSVKLVTQENISAATYNIYDASKNCTAFQGSYMEYWLNDTSVDGFLGNLREPEKFIKMDSKWNATMSTDTSKLAGTTIVTDAVGLLNIYEYTKSYTGTTAQLGYLNNGLLWWQLTSTSESVNTRAVRGDGGVFDTTVGNYYGIRPAINIKASINIVGGDGTIDDPYRLSGDTDIPTNGTLLNTRYSGEYVRFGDGDNTLYRVVSHELGGTKLVSAYTLKDSTGTHLLKPFSNNASYLTYLPSDHNYEIAYFLNHDFLNPANGYLTSNQVDMIDNGTWYLGSVNVTVSYRMTKYTTDTGTTLTGDRVDAQVGLLRLGEQLASIDYQNKDENSSFFDYWLLTGVKANPYVFFVDTGGNSYMYEDTTVLKGIRPALHLKQSVKIIGGDGTKDNPFTISQ